MFSKNFYEIDEVIASLIASLFRQAPIETLFWAKELIDSSATSYLIEALVLVYTLKFGGARLEYINVLSGIVLRKNWNEHDLMRVTYLLTLIGPQFKCHAILDYLTELSTAEGELNIVSDEWLGRRSDAFDVAMHYLMEVVDASEESLAPLELPKLPSILGIIFKEKGRKRRFFPVCARDLYGMSKRGCISYKENTDERLLTAHKTYYTANCWRVAPGPADAYSENDRIVERWEEWMQQIFPDDIPDEWSKEEREKSHGFGALREGEKVLASKWLELHLGIKNANFDNKSGVYLPYELFLLKN
jgi:hypothetical protein